MKAVSREVFGMLGQLFVRDAKHIENNYTVTIGNFLEFSIEDHDALLVLTSQRWRYSRSTRDVRKVRDHDRSPRSLFQPLQNCVVGLRKLLELHPSSDIVDAD